MCPVDTLNDFAVKVSLLNTGVVSFRSSHPEVLLVKGALKIGRKFRGEHPCRSVISIKLQSKATLLKSHFGMSVLL